MPYDLVTPNARSAAQRIHPKRAIRNHMTIVQHTHFSSHREVLIEHLFVGEVMRCLWIRGISQLEVLKPQVDDGGYDLVFELNSIMRHVQLKSSVNSAVSAEVQASLNLLSKPGACVIWIQFDSETIQLGPYLWFGGVPGERMPDIAELKIAKHVRENANGVKAERPNHRVIPKRLFEKVDDIDGIIARLFGTLQNPSTSSIAVESGFASSSKSP